MTVKNYNYYISASDFYFGRDEDKERLIDQFFQKIYDSTSNYEPFYNDGISEWEDKNGDIKTVFIIRGKVQ